MNFVKGQRFDREDSFIRGNARTGDTNSSTRVIAVETAARRRREDRRNLYQRASRDAFFFLHVEESPCARARPFDDCAALVGIGRARRVSLYLRHQFVTARGRAHSHQNARHLPNARAYINLFKACERGSNVNGKIGRERKREGEERQGKKWRKPELTRERKKEPARW